MATLISYAPPPVTAPPRVKCPAGRAAVIALVRPLGFRAQPAFFAAIALAGGVALSRVSWTAPARLLLGLLLLAGIALALRHRSRLALLPLLAAWTMLGYFVAEVEPEVGPRPNPRTALTALDDGAKHRIVGEVVRSGAVRSVEAHRPFGQARQAEQEVSVQLRVLSADGAATPSSGMRLALYAPAGVALQAPECGDLITVETALKLPQQYRDPGVWDARSWLASQGITVLGAADMRAIRVDAHAAHASLACRLHALQVEAASRIMRLADRSPPFLPQWLRLTGDDTGMLTAMVTGDRSWLERGERQGFERTGAFHVLVVSGLHVGLIAALVFACASRLRLGRNWAALATAAVALGYAVFTGFGAPVQRALWMVLLYLAARALFRQKQALQAAGVAALCLLAWDPRALFDAGLQMTLLTVLATGGLVAPLAERSFGPYLAGSKRIGLAAIDPALPPRLAQMRVMLRLCAEALAPWLPPRPSAAATARVLASVLGTALRGLQLLTVSAMVELVMALPMALYFHRATLLALPVNLLLIPMLGLLLPVAVLTAGTALVWAKAAMLPAILLAALLHLAVGIVHVFARIPAGDLRVATPPVWAIAASVALLGAAIWGMRQRRGLAILAMTGLAAAMLVLVLPHGVRSRPGVLEVTALDVGQGDALLVVTPSGKTLAIDSGGPTGGDMAPPGNFEIGEDVVSPALWSRGIHRLDAVALTHAHSDHMGGMFAVLRNFHPRELWVGHNPPSREYEALLAEARQLGISVRSFHAGDAFPYGGVEVRVLAPAVDYRPSDTARNDDSLVLRLAYRNTSALLAGDAEAPSEMQMAALPAVRSDVLKVGHHGSKTSTTAAFLRAVAPRYAVVSVGAHNPYHHPRFETLEHLGQAGVQTWRTDLDGMSTFYLDGERVTAAP